MRNAVGSHATALAEGLLSQPRCGEPGAGPYCIATPRGLGVVAEVTGNLLSLIVGQYDICLQMFGHNFRTQNQSRKTHHCSKFSMIYN